jgi:hypothetical protein
VPRLAAIILASAAAMSLVSCGPPRPGSGQGSAAPAGLTVASWPFVPVKIRVHPLTRISARPAPDRRLELHVECLDGEGDSVRTIGTLAVQLGDAPPPPDQDLSRLAVNAALWDRVTRTYRLSLPLPEAFECEPGRMLPVIVELRLTEDPAVALRAEDRIPCP